MERRSKIYSRKGHIVISTLIILSLVIIGTLVFIGGEAGAVPQYFDSYCLPCHQNSPIPGNYGKPVTCNGCHMHGAYSNITWNYNLSATTDRPSYKPGETVNVTITGGWQFGWVGAALFDAGIACAQNSIPGFDCTGHSPNDLNTWLKLAEAPYSDSGLMFPITQSSAAPSQPGTYKWAATYTSNYFDPANQGWNNFLTPTCNRGNMILPCSEHLGPVNSNVPGETHAYEYFYTNSFVVTNGPIINLSPASIDFGSVKKRSSVKRTIKVQNLGLSVLKVTGIARASGTSTEYTWSPSPSTTKPMSVPVGGSSNLTVTYTPIDTSTDAGALVITSNDLVTPQKNLAISGKGF